MVNNPIIIEYNGKKYSRAETILALKLYDDLKSGELVKAIKEEISNE